MYAVHLLYSILCFFCTYIFNTALYIYEYILCLSNIYGYKAYDLYVITHYIEIHIVSTLWSVQIIIQGQPLYNCLCCLPNIFQTHANLRNNNAQTLSMLRHHAVCMFRQGHSSTSNIASLHMHFITLGRLLAF